MAVSDIRREHVLAAIAEFDKLGRKAFLNKYSFGPTRKNWISYNGRFYDAHPIVGVAHGFATGEFWTKTRWFYAGGISIAYNIFQDLGIYPGGGELYPIENLKADFSHGRRAPYQYVVLLWAFARARAGQPRLVAFNEVRAELAELLAPFALTDSDPDPAMPWAALGNSVTIRQTTPSPTLPWAAIENQSYGDLWEMDRQGISKITDSDVKRLNMVGGLGKGQYALAQDSRYRHAAVEVMNRFIGDEPAFPELLVKLGLTRAIQRVENGLTDEAAEAIEAVLNPRRKFSRQTNAAENTAIEEHAVRVVRDCLENERGYATEDVGADRSYDIHATKGDEVLKVEVKGTTTDGSSVTLTYKEVELHQREHPNTALAVVRRIVLDRTGDKPVASGGVLEWVEAWPPQWERLKATTYNFQTGL